MSASSSSRSCSRRPPWSRCSAPGPATTPTPGLQGPRDLRQRLLAHRGENVRVSGVNVGKIAKLDVTDDNRAAVVLEITEPAFQDFRADAKCTIRPQSLIGEKYVECSPTQPRPAGREGAAGVAPDPRGRAGRGRVPAAGRATSKPVDLDLINNITRLPERQRLAIILNEFGAGVAGRGAELNETIRRANPALGATNEVLGILAEQEPGPRRPRAQLRRGPRTAGPRPQPRHELHRERGTVARATAERRADLERNFARLPRFLSELRPTMRRLGSFSDEFQPVLEDLQGAAPDVNRLFRELGPFSQAGIPAIESLGQALEVGRPALVRSKPIVDDLRRLTDEARPLASNLSDLLVSLRDRGAIERFLDFLYYQGTAVNGFDQFGHYLRAGLIVNTCSQYTNEPQPGCSARFGSGENRVNEARAARATMNPANIRRAFRANAPVKDAEGAKARSAQASKGPAPMKMPDAVLPGEDRAPQAQDPQAQQPAAAVPAAAAAALGGQAPATGTSPAQEGLLDYLPRRRSMSGRRGAASIAANPVLIGAATTLVVIVAVFLAYNANNGLPFVPTYDLRAEVPNANNLVRGNEVRIGGTRIGVVDKIEPRRKPDGTTSALLSLKLETAVKPLPVDSRIVVRSRSALGLKYVEITKGSSRAGFESGATIPIARATPAPVEIDEFFAMFDEPTRAAQRTNLNEFGGALAGRGQALNEALGSFPALLRNLQPVAENLSDDRTELAGFFRGLGQAAAEAAPVAEQQASLFRNLDTTFAALADVTPEIQESISTGPEALNAAIESFPVQRRFLANSEGFFRELRPGVRALRAAAPDLSRAFQIGRPVLTRSIQLNRRLIPTFQALQAFAEDPLTSLGVNGLRNTARILNPTIADLAPVQTVCNYGTTFFRNASSLLSEGDGQGTWQRFIIVAAPTGPNNEGGPANEPANGGPQSGVPTRATPRQAVPAPGGGDPTRNFLHANPYPNTPTARRPPGRVRVGNEPWLQGRKVVGNVPGQPGHEHRADAHRARQRGQPALAGDPAGAGRQRQRSGGVMRNPFRRRRHAAGTERAHPAQGPQRRQPAAGRRPAAHRLLHRAVPRLHARTSRSRRATRSRPSSTRRTTCAPTRPCASPAWTSARSSRSSATRTPTWPSSRWRSRRRACRSTRTRGSRSARASSSRATSSSTCRPARPARP
jgi:virulence factor Mce-like protein